MNSQFVIGSNIFIFILFVVSFLHNCSLRPRQAKNKINDTYVLLHIYFFHIICNQTYLKSLLLPWKIALARVMRSIFVALALPSLLVLPGPKHLKWHYYTLLHYIHYEHYDISGIYQATSPRKLRECSDWLSTSICSICDDRNKFVTIDANNF